MRHVVIVLSGTIYIYIFLFSAKALEHHVCDGLSLIANSKLKKEKVRAHEWLRISIHIYSMSFQIARNSIPTANGRRCITFIHVDGMLNTSASRLHYLLSLCDDDGTNMSTQTRQLMHEKGAISLSSVLGRIYFVKRTCQQQHTIHVERETYPLTSYSMFSISPFVAYLDAIAGKSINFVEGILREKEKESESERKLFYRVLSLFFHKSTNFFICFSLLFVVVRFFLVSGFIHTL